MLDEPQLERHTENISTMNAILQLHDKVDGVGKLLRDHIIEESDVVAAKVARVLIDSFPDGDAIGHRKKHEADIAAAEDRARFWKKMQFALSQWGLIGFIAWAGWQLWKAFLQGPK